MRELRLYVITFLLLLLAACGATTKIEGQWSDENLKGRHPGKTLIIGITHEPSARQKLEDSLVNQLARHGIKAIASTRIIANEDQLTKENVITIVKDNNFNSVLLTRLQAIKQQDVYAPSSKLTSMTYFDSYADYYKDLYGTVNQPGSNVNYTTVNLETNLYDAKTEKMIWSVATRTDDGTTAEQVISSMKKVVITEMVNSGFLPAATHNGDSGY